MSAIIAAIYARKSNEQKGDEEDRSVARQIAKCRAFAAQKGWTVDEAHIYSDYGISGAAVKKLLDKQRLLAVIDSGRAPFSVVICQHKNRWSRRPGDESFGELKRVTRKGVQVWFYDGGRRFEYGTFATNLVGFAEGEAAAEYIRDIATKTTEGLRHRAAMGKVTGGRVYGYENVCSGCRRVIPFGMLRCCPGHTDRLVNATEAAAVVRVHEMYAAGSGLAVIAHALNASGVPSPRAQQGRVKGWCPASVREVLKRPLYRGEMIHGRMRKLEADEDGHRQRVNAPEETWVRKDRPDLRIVPPELAAAVDARRASMHSRALRLSNGRLMGRPPGEGSPYLLTGLLTCGVCGGGMEVLSSSSAGRRLYQYRCYVARRKGPACCTNKLPARMAEADAAVLAEIKRTLLHPEVVERALVHAERAIARGQSAGEREALQADLAETKRAMRRLSSAIAKGGELEALVTALQTQERQRAEQEARLAELANPAPAMDAAAVRTQLNGYVRDWEALLRGQLGQAQQVLRRLIVGRLVFTPQADGFYKFSGKGTVKPLLGGVIRKLASPAGFGRLWYWQVEREIRFAA
jgi:DNA invertase Pin-like site-specific DNA recombinase